jgi:hypothetical protein
MGESLIIKECDSYNVDIFIAGDYNTSCNLLQNYCEKGFCVSVQKVRYIYTMGREEGVRVTLINYPRFPSDKNTIIESAKEIANTLIYGLSQASATIQTPEKSIFISRKKEDLCLE